MVKGFGISLMVLLLFSCKEKQPMVHEPQVETLPYFNTQDFTPTWSKGIHKIPPFSLQNQEGDTITNATFDDKIYVANFFFTICPSICPRLTESMHTLQEQYANDNAIQLLSHSVMPWYDTVEVLAEYAEKHKVDATKWNLVTGSKDEIYNLARNGYFADEDFGKTLDEANFIHTENFILVDKQGYIRGVYNGTIPFDMKRLARHIALLKNEYQI